MKLFKGPSSDNKGGKVQIFVSLVEWGTHTHKRHLYFKELYNMLAMRIIFFKPIFKITCQKRLIFLIHIFVISRKRLTLKYSFHRFYRNLLRR